MTPDPRAKVLESRRAALNISYRSIGEQLGINYESIRKYLQGLNIPRNPDVWDQISKVLGDAESTIEKSIEKFSTQAKLPVETQTPVYYTGSDKDSAEGFTSLQLAAAADVVSINAWQIQVGSSWSAKSMGKVTVKLSALLGAASWHIVIKGELENIRSGSVVAFTPFTYPEEGIYLLFKSNNNDEDLLFGWILGGRPTLIQTGGEPVSITDWQPIGKAIAVAWGPGEHKKKAMVGLDGLGPMDRIQ